MKKHSHSLVFAVTVTVAMSLSLIACDDSSSASSDDKTSSSSEKTTNSSDSKTPASESSSYDCSVKDGVKVVYPKGGESFKMGDKIKVVYGSDVKGSGFRFVFKTSESDAGLDMLEESAGPESPDGKTCYEQEVVLSDEYAEATETAIIRVIPYEKTAKAANSGTFKVTK
jgi:hypothetical protein